MGRLTLILGGARSGKSSYAQALAAGRGRQIVYIATAEGLDPEMEARIAAHKTDRPEEWQTVEIPFGIGRALRVKPIQADLVVLDCLTMLVSNLLLSMTKDENEPDEITASLGLEVEMDELIATIQGSQAEWVIVSNEVGMGLVPPYPLGRIYRDLLGKANRQLAAFADEVYLLVAGIPVPIHSFRI